MLSTIISGATVGLESIKVDVEVDLPDQGFPGFSIVGLPGKAIREAVERVRSAIKNSGCSFPNKRITVNLTPADLPKEGPAYDLPIALGILIADKQVEFDLSQSMFFGELSLDGSLRRTCGALPLTILCKQLGMKSIFLPKDNVDEAMMIQGIDVYPIDSLAELVAHMRGEAVIKPVGYRKVTSIRSDISDLFDLADVKGQEQAKRVMEIAAAGGHNVLMIGSPGSGKTMLSRVLPSILPEMTEEEMLEVTKIYSITGHLSEAESVIRSRPFRSPHHTTSMSGLVGGGSHPRPGEVSLAHRGVLFLDEFLEFPRHTLEALRQPLEDGIVTVSRVAGTLQFPAQFLLIAAANPCPCGYLNSTTKTCICLPGMIERYRKRLSGPILDRIDLHITVPEVEVDKLGEDYVSEASSSVRERVDMARGIQIRRYQDKKLKLFCNADMSTKHVRLICELDKKSQELLSQAVRKMGLSARSYFRVIKISRTIADLEGSELIQVKHVAEALQYRPG